MMLKIKGLRVLLPSGFLLVVYFLVDFCDHVPLADSMFLTL